jgi:hypothetical protein
MKCFSDGVALESNGKMVRGGRRVVLYLSLLAIALLLLYSLVLQTCKAPDKVMVPKTVRV